MATTRPNKNISDFKSKLIGGGARPNLFEVELTTLPDGVTRMGVLTHSNSYVKQLHYLHRISHQSMFLLEVESLKLLETEQLILGL